MHTRIYDSFDSLLDHYGRDDLSWGALETENENGLIKHTIFDTETGDPVFVTTLEPGDDSILHYGVEGMKWGIRKDLVEFELYLKDQLAHSMVQIPTEHSDYVELTFDRNNTICHYGILGMRWGVRRRKGSDGLVGKGVASEQEDASKNPSSNSKSSSRPSVSAEVKVEDTVDLPDEQRVVLATEFVRAKGFEVDGVVSVTENELTLRVHRPMTNDELREKIVSMRLEQEYEQLAKVQNGSQVADLRTKVDQVKLQREYDSITARQKSAGRKVIDKVVAQTVNEIGSKAAKAGAAYIISKIVGGANVTMTKGDTKKVSDLINQATKSKGAGPNAKEAAEVVTKVKKAGSEISDIVKTIVSKGGSPVTGPPYQPIPTFRGARGSQINQIIKELSKA